MKGIINRIERLEYRARKSDVPYLLFVQDRDSPDRHLTLDGQVFTRAQLDALPDNGAPLLIVKYETSKRLSIDEGK